MLEDVRMELYGESKNHEESEAEKKERQAKETEETIQKLRAMGNKKE